MIGGLLTDSGGADRVVEADVDRVGPRALPWAMAGVAALIGIPLFFEVGVVLLVPIVLLVARRATLPVLARRDPGAGRALRAARLHPAPPRPARGHRHLKADLGLVLLFGLIVAIPSVIIAGPLVRPFISRPRPSGPARRRGPA